MIRVLHPEASMSDSHAIQLTDIDTANELGRRWENEGAGIQAEFGWDLPLYHVGGHKAPTIIKMKYAEYVKLVSDYRAEGFR